MNHGIIVAFVAGTLLFGGCNKSTPPPPPATVEEPAPNPRLQQLQASVTIGMTESQVVAAVGEPKHSVTIMDGRVTMTRWEYELPHGGTFQVRFGKGDLVVGAELQSVRVQ